MSQFTYVKRGYSPEEVDKYIANLETIIKSYREKDNAIKNAIISAQVAADNMVKNARMQADEYKVQIARELENLRGEINRERMNVQNFQDSYAGMIRTYLQKLDDGQTSGVHSRLDDMEKLINHLLATDIIPSIEQSTPALEAKPDPKPEPRPIPREEIRREEPKVETPTQEEIAAVKAETPTQEEIAAVKEEVPEKSEIESILDAAARAVTEKDS